MKRLVQVLVLAGLVAGGFVLGSYVETRRVAGQNPSTGRKIHHYVDPMNPAHTTDKPGLAPCGMQMVPVYQDETTGSAAQAGAPALPIGAIQISLDKQQLIGVQTAVVEKKLLSQSKRLLGRVVTDETRLYWVNATVDGWVTDAMPLATGDFVKQNQVLAAFHSAEFLAPGHALLFALNSKDRAQGAGPSDAVGSNRVAQFNINLQQYIDSLKSLGMGEPQIQKMISTRQFIPNVDIIAPADGFILARKVSLGQRFTKGAELYRIADLSRVWILADVFENEADLITPHQAVRVFSSSSQRTFPATVSGALPQFDPISRTLKVRLEVDNPDYALRPDMFVDVEVPIQISDGLFVAAEAVLDTGQSTSVFLDRGNGVFEPRRVKIGRRLGDQVQILGGLEPGERIVVSGTFLLDSESRMRLAAASPSGGSAMDPVCGMAVDPQKAKASRRFSAYQGRTYYFCSDNCLRSFNQDPVAALHKPAPANGDSDHASMNHGSMSP
jgi:membrane fusion protein, copper/silver efflux system